MKFNFLKPGDPYNAYYKRKIEEIRSPGEATEEKVVALKPPEAPPAVKELKKSVLPPTQPLEPPEEEVYTIHGSYHAVHNNIQQKLTL